MKIKHTRTHFYTAGPILFLHDDAMNLNAKTYNIEFSALSFPYFKIPPTYTSTCVHVECKKRQERPLIVRYKFIIRT